MLTGICASWRATVLFVGSSVTSAPKVEYGVIDWGDALCPALGELLKWAASREDFMDMPAERPGLRSQRVG